MRNNSTTPPPLLGPRLRALRRAKGLSLNDLASAVGSSASAIHRYESGWGRFEIRTLRRLAAALEARLEVQLEPVPHLRAAKSSAARLARKLRPLFWDTDLSASVVRDHPQWVLRRVLQFGGWTDVQLVRSHFGDEAVREASQHRSVDPRTRRLWQVILEPESR